MIDIHDLYPGKKDQSIINLLRNKYASMEEAYLKETSNSPGKCIYCGSNTKFISVVKGYKDICERNECKKKRYSDKLDEIYNKHKTVNCKVCGKPYTIYIDRKKNNSSVYICEQDFCQRNKNRLFINEKIKINIDDPYDYSFINNLIYNLRLKYNINKVRRILFRNLLNKGIEDVQGHLNHPSLIDVLTTNINDLELTKDKKYWIYFKKRDIVDYHKKIYDNYFSYIEQYYPESISTCMICDKKYIFKHPFKQIKLSSENTCSLECYYKNFKHYITDERRKKQSDSMRLAIKEGKFKPNILNSMTHKNISILDYHGNTIQRFRSSWELVYYVMNYSKNIEYEKLKLPYKFNNEPHTYFVDFINRKEKYVVEVKGNFKQNKEINIIKHKTLTEWSNSNNYKYYLIDYSYFSKIEYNEFLYKLKELNFSVNDKILNNIKRYLK